MTRENRSSAPAPVKAIRTLERKVAASNSMKTTIRAMISSDENAVAV